MRIEHLHQIFSPSSVAIMGAGDAPGRNILANLLSGGFKGRLYAVGQEEQTVAGLPVWPDFKSIGDAVDLAVLAVSFDRLTAAIDACGQAGIRSALILARDLRRQAELEQIATEARNAGVRLIGPRSWGIVSPRANLNAALGREMPPQGQLAVISQSAAICAAVLDLSLSKQIGLSHLIGLGDMLDIDCADLLDYMATHAGVRAVLIHLEQITHMRKFMSAARAASRIKPVVILKTGRAQTFDGPGAVTHTGRLIRTDDVYDAAFKRAGIIRVDTVADLFDCGDLLSKQPRPRGSNLAIVSNARSPGIMAVDFLNKRDLQPAALSPETIAALDRILLSCWNRQNPIIIRDKLSAETYRQLIGLCQAAPEIDGILIIIAPQFLAGPQEVAGSITAAVSIRRKPLFAVWMGGKGLEAGRRILDEAGIPTYDAPETAVRAFLHLNDYDHNLRLLQEIPRKMPARFAANRARARKIIDSVLERKRPLLNRLESLSLLEAYDLPTTSAAIARNTNEALNLAERWGYPISLMPLDRCLGNGSAAGNVGLELHDAAGLRKAMAAHLKHTRGGVHGAEAPGVLVQPAIARPDYEFRLSGRLVAPFGPVILFGCGRIATEVVTDQAIGLPPLNRLLAGSILAETRLYRILKSRQESLPACTAALEEFLCNFSHLITDFPEIGELEIGSLLAVGERVFAAHAQAMVAPASSPSPMHLIISAYPDEYETRAVTKTGVPIFIRPIKPEDAPLLQEFWSSLSPRTLYYRFSSPAKALTPELLVRLTQIDYDREIALIALDAAGSGDRMLGVARLTGQSGGDKAEFAIVIGDPWQGLGVGARLLSCLAAIALRRKIKNLWGLVLKENRAMLELGRKLGWTLIADEDPSQVFLQLDLSAVDAPEIRDAFEKDVKPSQIGT
jgi:acetyltransferase